MSQVPPSKDIQLTFLLALVVLGRWDALKREIRQAAKLGIPYEQVREILLQSHLFAGFPRCLEAMEILASVQSSGMFASLPKPSPQTTAQNNIARGRELFDRIYAGKAEDVLSRIESFHPELRNWILDHAYGEVLSRPELSPRQRELAAVAALIASRQWKQLLSHLRGAQRCGASPDEMHTVIEKLKGVVPPASLRKARKLSQQS